MTDNFTFPKELRLLNAFDYSNVFQGVQLRVSSKNFLILAKNCNKPEARIGIIVAKKNVKLAVQRNRLKRQLRETFRKQREVMPSLDLVLLAKKGADLNTNASISEELDYLWRKLKRKASS